MRRAVQRVKVGRYKGSPRADSSGKRCRSTERMAMLSDAIEQRDQGGCIKKRVTCGREAKRNEMVVYERWCCGAGSVEWTCTDLELRAE